jgi:hypothetical protein
MAVLDLAACPICQARDSLERQTTQLESRTHVRYECLECGTLLVWLGDEMWLEADRWSFQKVGLPEGADLLYRSMTVAELRKLAGEKPPYTAAPVKETSRAIPPPIWIEMMPTEEERFEEVLPEEVEEVAPAAIEEEAQPEVGAGAAVVAAALLAQQAAAQQAPALQAAAQDEELQTAAQQAAAQQAEAQEPPAEASVGTAVVGAAALTQKVQQAAAQPAEVQPAEVQPAALQAPPVAPVQAETPAPDDAPGAGPPPARSDQQQRRGRGSPFLVISVGLVLLCLICSAAAMVIYSMWENFPAGVGPTVIPAASEVLPTETATPTETMVPTDTPSPSPTPSPMATEGAPPETADGVEFQGVTDYVSSTGSHYLVGEVLNKTPDTLRFVEVLATFYDADGQLVGTGSTFTELSMIEPGSTAPFKMTTLNPPTVGHYDLRVDYSTTTQPPIRLEITGHSGSVADTGWYHVAGEVRNPHDFTIKFSEIVATYYNATHEVVRVEVDFAELDPLEPGQSSPFEVILTDPPADLQHYALQTEAVQQ